ncbi:MAG: LysM peptidoglycan-binding domain-containing protein [Deltaproteobacteria bacterium]|nr:LysM peptidoglycan-binding domain-containing protein [Deltaproteobacteria bacterium]
MLATELLRDGLPAGTVTDLLLRPDDGTLLMAFLVVVGVAAWLVLALSLLGELAAALTGRPGPRIALPGFRWGRSVAAALVAALLGAGPAIAAPALSAQVSTLAVVEPRQVSTPTPSDELPGNGGLVHVVEQRDTLWRIAETTLGDPLRWREIYDLNAGRVQPDGGRLTEGSLLTVGWRLTLPSDAGTAVLVAPGDTLTGLAAQHLGDPALANELFDANAAAPQSDGTTLTDPDLIHPGWTLALPDRAVTPDAGAARPAAPEPGADQDSDAPAPSPTPTTTAPDPSATDTSAPDATEPVPWTAPSTTSTTGAGPPRVPAGEVEPGDVQSEGRQSLTAPALGVSALVVGGVVASLALHRRRQLRLRPFRHRVAVPADDDGRLEWSLAHPDPRSRATQSVSQRLDLALRCLTHPDQGDGDPVGAIRSVRLTDADVLITMSGDAGLPAPFTSAGEPGVWGLDADEALPVPAEEAAGCCAPFPTLASIGTDDDRTLMIDLEERGILRVGGDPARGGAFLRHLAAELATSRTAEDSEIFLVGLGDELPALNPEQLVATELDLAITDIEQRVATTRAALDRHGLPSVVDGRRRNLAPDSWLPTVLLVGRQLDEQELARVDALAVSGTAVAVVVLDDSSPHLRIGADGLLDLGDIEDGPWKAAQLTEHAGTHLAALLGTTGAPSEPVGAANATESWATDMDDDGALGDHPTDVDDPNDKDERDDDPKGDDDPANKAFDSIPSPRSPNVDPEAERRLAIVNYQDPNLDDDLAAWRREDSPAVPIIAILGEPTVRAPGPIPTTRPSWFAEVLVYLSLHPAGVTSAKAVTDLWPDGHRISPATIRHAFYGARRWAGRGLGGDPDLQFVSDMQHDSTYRLRGHLLDWDLFRRLRKRAQARRAAGHHGAIADYEAALALVRGAVLSSLRPGGYAWLNNHDQRHDLQIPGFIVDTAHELVDIALDSGDTATARRAAEHARLIDVDVAFDRPLTDLMRVAHAEDNRSEMELYAAVLLDARGFDVPEELAPDSFTVLNELLPSGPRRPGS